VKHVAALLLAVVLAAEFLVFVGVGYGSSAFAATAPPSLSSSCSNGAVSFCVDFATPSSTAGAEVANWVNGLSTPITFYIANTIDESKCSQSPGWDAGNGQAPAYAQVQVIDANTGKVVPFINQSTNNVVSPGTVTESSNAFYVSFNSSVDQSAYCYGDTHRSQLSQTDWSPTTLQLVGQFTDYSKIVVTFFTSGSYCATGLAQGPLVCNLDTSGSGLFQRDVVGSWNAVAIGETYLRNGGGFFSWNGQALYNGEKFTVPVTTYYDAGQGFRIQFLYPSVRGSAVIATATVPDEKTSYGVTFTVPSNAAMNSSTPNYNQFQLTLFSPVAQYTYQNIPIDIAQPYAPPAPSVTFVDVENAPPQVNDQVSVSVSAAGVPKFHENVTEVLLWVWYVTPYTSSGSLPPSGSSAWITSGGPSGYVLSTVLNNGTATGVYPFTLTQPYSIAVQAESVTNTGQSSNQVAFTVYVQPPGCSGPSCQHGVPSTFWESFGPAVLAAMVLTASLFVLLIPIKNLWFRILPIAVVVAAIALLWVVGVWPGWFQPGAVFNHAPG
jgi:hypothetical protein